MKIIGNYYIFGIALRVKIKTGPSGYYPRGAIMLKIGHFI